MKKHPEDHRDDEFRVDRNDACELDLLPVCAGAVNKVGRKDDRV